MDQTILIGVSGFKEARVSVQHQKTLTVLSILLSRTVILLNDECACPVQHYNFKHNALSGGFKDNSAVYAGIVTLNGTYRRYAS